MTIMYFYPAALLYSISGCNSFISIGPPLKRASDVTGTNLERTVTIAKLSPISQFQDQIEVLAAVDDLPASEEVCALGSLFKHIDVDGSGSIEVDEVEKLLELMGLHATPEEAHALFQALDKDGSGEVDFQEFQEWFLGQTTSAELRRTQVMEALLGRRTVNEFESDPIPDAVVEDAILAATFAPNHRMTQPWMFRQLGPATVEAVAALNAEGISDPKKAEAKLKRWAAVPGWIAVTSKRSDDEIIDIENYAATCCAIQNLCLAFWAEGVGSKWTTGDVTRSQEFADLCGIDLSTEKVAGVIWFGLAKGGLDSIPPPNRRPVADVHIKLP